MVLVLVVVLLLRWPLVLLLLRLGVHSCPLAQLPCPATVTAHTTARTTVLLQLLLLLLPPRAQRLGPAAAPPGIALDVELRLVVRHVADPEDRVAVAHVTLVPRLQR